MLALCNARKERVCPAHPLNDPQTGRQPSSLDGHGLWWRSSYTCSRGLTSKGRNISPSRPCWWRPTIWAISTWRPW